MRAVIVKSSIALAAVITTAGVVAAQTGTTAMTAASGTSVAGVSMLSGGGTAPRLTVQSGANIETPSGTYLQVTRATFRSTAGPVTVRFSGSGYALDWTGPAPRFVGRSYSALLVRVLMDGAAMSPGAVAFADNTGKITVNERRARATSFEWVAQVPAGNHRVVVQFRNRAVWDVGGLERWSLVVQHP